MSEEDNTLRLTHLNADGMPRMVDVGGKSVTRRTTMARGSISLPESFRLDGTHSEIMSPKGPVIQTAIVAGTQAVKKTAEIIPFCHPIPLDLVRFACDFGADHTLEITCKVGCNSRTGVEMEALSGVTAALLTVYDMCKSAGQDMVLHDIQVVRKTGGKSDLSREEQ